MADRSVSINLRAKVSDFVSGMGQAKRSTEDLSRQMVATGAYAAEFRKRLEAATKALPKIEIDADSSPAEIKFAELRAEMEKLADKKIGIDIDAASAQAQLQEIERELEKLAGQSATIDVKADISTALAELRAVDAEVSRVNGQDARVNVDADVGSALAGIAMVGAALAALPAVTTIAVGVTALGSAFAAAGIGAAAFGAVAVPSLGRINDALKAQASAAQSAGAATGGAGQSAAQAAQQAMQLEAAEKRLKDAQTDAKAAQEDLTRAREAGRRALEDLNFSLDRSILSQKDAALAVKEAAARMDEVNNDAKASDLDRERAALNYEMALQRSEEQEVKTARARKDTTVANKAGVEGTKEYTKAQDNLVQAQAKVTEAAAALKQMQLQQQAAMSGGGGAAAKLKDAFAGLSAQEKVLAKDIQAFTKEYLAWQRSLQPEVFPVIAQGLDLMRLGLREAGPLAKSASVAFLQLGKDAEASLNGPFWQQFLFNLNTQIPGAITGLGASFGHVVTGIAGIIDAFLPFTPTVVGGVEQAAKAFSEWGQGLKNSPEFKEFIEFVKTNAPQVWELIKNIAKAIGNIAQAMAPLGVGAFSGLSLLAEIVAGMDPARIRDIALAIGAIKLATLGMSAVSAWQGLAGGIAASGAAAGKASGKMAALGKATIGIAAGVIGLEAAGSAINSLEGQSKGVDKLTLALTELGQTGKWAGDLSDQWAGGFHSADEAAAQFRDGLRELQDPSLYEMLFDHPFTEIGALLPGIDSSVDRLEQRFSDLDNTLAGMVTSGNLAGANASFDQLAKQAAEAGIPVDKLKELLPTYSQAVRVAGNDSATAAAGVDLAKQKMDGFNSSLGTFAGRTDALQALSNMKLAFNEAEKAVHAANGKLEINSRMTDEQKNAVILAREKFAGYIESVRLAADGAQTLTGKTTDGTRAVLEQLPEMAKLAGKNQEAREQIILLAQAYGISREDAIKAMGSAKGLRDMLAQLKSREIEITANTEKAQNALKALLSTYIKPYDIPIGIRAPTTPPKKKERGGIERYATGGIRSTAPGIAAQPTILYGEGSAPEAFIPFDPKYRGRAVELLGQVADTFGLQVFNKRAEQQVSQVAVTVGDASIQLGAGLQSAVTTLQSTMGQAGSLTSSIGQVGASADQLNQSWLAGSQIIGDTVGVMGTVTSDAVTVMTDGMTSSIDTLSVSVASLGSVLSAAAEMTSSTSTGGSKSKAKPGAVDATATKSTAPRKGKAGAVDATAKKTTAPRKGTGGMIAGDYGLSGTPDWSSAFSYGSAPVNSSRVSRPQQVPAYTVGAGSVASQQGVSASSGGSASRPGGLVTIQGDLVVREKADADLVASYISARIDSKGF